MSLTLETVDFDGVDEGEALDPAPVPGAVADPPEL
jgi:hypothetical protein